MRKRFFECGIAAFGPKYGKFRSIENRAKSVAILPMAIWEGMDINENEKMV